MSLIDIFKHRYSVDKEIDSALKEVEAILKDHGYKPSYVKEPYHPMRFQKQKDRDCIIGYKEGVSVIVSYDDNWYFSPGLSSSEKSQYPLKAAAYKGSSEEIVGLVENVHQKEPLNPKVIADIIKAKGGDKYISVFEGLDDMNEKGGRSFLKHGGRISISQLTDTLNVFSEAMIEGTKLINEDKKNKAEMKLFTEPPKKLSLSEIKEGIIEAEKWMEERGFTFDDNEGLEF